MGNGKAYPEVGSALDGAHPFVVRANAKGETIISVAVPIQRFRSVRGALLLSTMAATSTPLSSRERWGIIRIFLVSAGVMLLISLFFTNTITEPMRRLAEAAERVRRGAKSRQEIPDFSDRPDEIGHLSGALRDMTKALYNRIDAIEHFAADVAHELKNPLTSLRSAVETLPIAKNRRGARPPARHHQARRRPARPADQRHFRRLSARRRARARRHGHRRSLGGVVHRRRNDARRRLRRRRQDRADVRPSPDEPTRDHWRVLGHDSRLGQVLNNLIDNAQVVLEAWRDRARAAVARSRQGARAVSSSTAMRSLSTTTGPEFRMARSTASSNVSIPIVRNRDLARIPGWGYRFPARSSRRMADVSARSIARARIPRALTSRAPAIPCSARASSSGCRRRDDAAAARPHMCTPMRSSSAKVRPAAARTVRLWQERADAGADRPLGGRAALSRVWSATTAVALDARDGRLIARPHPAIPGHDRGARPWDIARRPMSPPAWCAPSIDLLDAQGRRQNDIRQEIETSDRIGGVYIAAHLRKRRARRCSPTRDWLLHSDSCDKLTCATAVFACLFRGVAQNVAPVERGDYG